MQRTGSRSSLPGPLLGCCLAMIACGTGTRGGGPGEGTGGRGGGGGAVFQTGGVNGSGSGGSVTGGGGDPATGGTFVSGGSAGTAGASGGGTPATGGGPAGATGTAGGAGHADAGAGGTASGGVGGGAGAGVPKAPAMPSSGCGAPTPATGSATSPLMISNHKYYVPLPATYDASKPYPLLFVFHGNGDPINWGQIYSGLETRAYNAIRVYPYSSTSGWRATDVPFFMPLYDELTAHFCVDKARVFAAGSDSGGNFASILGCEYASVVRGVALSGTIEPRAGTPDFVYPWDVTMRTCTGQATAIVIHGVQDVWGPEHGPKMRDFYRALNHCGTETTLVQTYPHDTKCLQVQGCDAPFPVYWCQHADPTYADSNHGWPSFASSLTWTIFSAY
jgi:polyhydroxybutyrate depolymerase